MHSIALVTSAGNYTTSANRAGKHVTHAMRGKLLTNRFKSRDFVASSVVALGHVGRVFQLVTERSEHYQLCLEVGS